jgi:hypothetical protein
MATLSSAQHAMVELFQKHVSAELAGDLDVTMETMTKDPHLIPTRGVPDSPGLNEAAGAAVKGRSQ